MAVNRVFLAVTCGIFALVLLINLHHHDYLPVRVGAIPHLPSIMGMAERAENKADSSETDSSDDNDNDNGDNSGEKVEDKGNTKEPESDAVSQDKKTSDGPIPGGPQEKQVEKPELTQQEHKHMTFWNPGPQKLQFTDAWLGGSCDEIWKKWLDVALNHKTGIPPKKIPDELRDQFTLSGRIPVSGLYFNNVVEAKNRTWKAIEKQVEYSKDSLIARSTYPGATTMMFNAMTYYKEKIEGTNAAVIGSIKPWAELFFLKHGAASTTTLEYWPIEIESGKYNMKWVHPIDIAKNWTKYATSFDVAVSFSSIEHSGLARYGDPIDPMGDLREVAKITCLLKKGGLLFLGFPVGKDRLYWNAHRVYGSIRLPWIMRGFKLIGVFYEPDQLEPAEGVPLHILWSNYWTNQPTLVLQKI